MMKAANLGRRMAMMVYQACAYFYYFIDKTIRWMTQIQTGTLYDCKPWQTGGLLQNTNLLNNFKQNLHCYEVGFRKFTIKPRCELPQISKCALSKASSSQRKISELEKISNVNKSTQLAIKLPKSKKSRGRLTKYSRQDAMSNKQNSEYPCTDRIRSKQDYKAKIFLINFQDQLKYRRMKKRQLHQVIFGPLSKSKRLKQCIQ